MKSNLVILYVFVSFMLGSLVTVLSLDQFLLEPSSKNRSRIVSELVSDVRNSEKEAALMIVNQCKDLGYAFVPDTSQSGYYLECNETDFKKIQDYRVVRMMENVKQYSSKRYHKDQ